MADLNGFKRYAVSFGDLLDEELNLCLEAAREYFRNAGVPDGLESPIYDLGVYRLAAYYVDNRLPSPDGGGDNVPYGIQGIILQLRGD